jgi:hypothetical protein
MLRNVTIKVETDLLRLYSTFVYEMLEEFVIVPGDGRGVGV